MADRIDPWFDNLYRQHSVSLIKSAAALLHDLEIAKELVQDVYIVLLLKREFVIHHPHPDAWLFRTMYRRAENEMRRAQYHHEVPLGPEHEQYPAFDWGCDNLEEALPADLSAEGKQFLLWYYQDGLSHEEIALRLGISVRASEGRLYRLRKLCCDLLTKK